MISDITLTDRQIFSAEESALLAKLVYRRFGNDLAAAVSAWKRMLQNSCTEEQFQELVSWGSAK